MRTSQKYFNYTRIMIIDIWLHTVIFLVSYQQQTIDQQMDDMV